MAWWYRIPRALAVPLVAVCVGLAGCALVLLAGMLPFLLLSRWARRTWTEWRAQRWLMRHGMMR